MYLWPVAVPPVPPSPPQRAALSRDLADFLVELSIALHKHAMYPGDHPSLEPAAHGAPPDAQAGGARARAAQLWVGLARAAMAGESTDEPPPSTEPSVIAKAIDAGSPQKAGAYDQAIVGYLLQIADELKTAG